MKSTVVLFIVSLLTACGGWQQQTFKSTNWYNLGFKEAQSGFTENWRDNYHMVYGTPDGFKPSEYQQGFSAGKQTNCRVTACPQIVQHKSD